jgi:hypothetical protein
LKFIVMNALIVRALSKTKPSRDNGSRKIFSLFYNVVK